MTVPSNKLASWLQRLEGRYIHAPIQLGLSRVKSVAVKLHIDKLSSVVITVGGTNGKGSTVKALETLYLAAGYKVGAYTSPHLLTFNERISCQGQAIDDEALCEAFSAVDKVPGADSLTYFEFTTLAALWVFKAQQLDVVILEVGMGGRLDATNLINADLAIITTIDFDHQAYLGDSLEAIGYEKAGILRANKPFIFASSIVPNSVRKVAAELGAVGYYYGIDYDLASEANGSTNLHPQSLSAAIQATRLLQTQLPISSEAYQSLNNLALAGRLQILSPDIVLDVAHNVQSVRRLSEWLHQTYPSKTIHAVFSALGDKPIRLMVELMKNQVMWWHVAPLLASRAASKTQLCEALEVLPSEHILWYNDLSLAFLGAKNQRQLGEIVVVFGSFLTVAAVLV